MLDLREGETKITIRIFLTFEVQQRPTLILLSLRSKFTTAETIEQKPRTQPRITSRDLRQRINTAQSEIKKQLSNRQVNPSAGCFMKIATHARGIMISVRGYKDPNLQNQGQLRHICLPGEISLSHKTD